MRIHILAPIQKQPVGGELKFALGELNVLQSELVFGRELKGATEFFESVKEIAALICLNPGLV